jgi:tetratricopeptide (TPR) repeat protein
VNKKKLKALDKQFNDELNMAIKFYEDDDYSKALKVLRSLPKSLETAELIGLCYYRQGYWLLAIKELELFEESSGTGEELPTIADCYRALGNFDKVMSIWDKIRTKGVEKEIYYEARLVVAGALADQDRLDEAIDLLLPGEKFIKNPKLRHLRTWYMLGDLYERKGNYVKAKTYFSRVFQFDPQLADVKERLDFLN